MTDRVNRPDAAALQDWLDSLKASDPELFAELSAQRLQQPAIVTESPAAAQIRLETIVRAGRPAFFIKDHRVALPAGDLEPAARVVVDRLMSARQALEPHFRLVGRIDLANHPGNMQYVGTGWLIADRVVVTNRHVAEIIARPDGGRYRFRAGRGGPLDVSVDYRREAGVDQREVASVSGVIWIAGDHEDDIAFLEVDRRPVPEGQPPFITLADEDAGKGTHVAVVGYPARAPADIIPDQAWMDRIYGGRYDVKRIAPGLLGDANRGSATHDCTTLGGNSGSVVLDLQGKAVALHYAGLYLVENYAVPASKIRAYQRAEPWRSPVRRRHEPSVPASSAPGGSGTITIPLTLTITLGTPGAPAIAVTTAGDIEQKARALAEALNLDTVLAVEPGYVVREGRLTDEDCLVVHAHPDAIAEVQRAAPAAFSGLPVEVRRASLDRQLEERIPGAMTEAVTSVQYNDADRTGAGFSFDWVEEEMELVLHVGPERSWVVLKEFLESAKGALVSSIYEFHARHIARALQSRLESGIDFTLVMGGQSRDHGAPKEGEFERASTFEKWGRTWKDSFRRVFVPTGSQGLVANAYHIKVSVSGAGAKSAVWLSSGNWKKTSQPEIAKADLDNPAVAARAGNREWHVVAHSPTLAERFRNHIKADFEQSRHLGGTPETPFDRLWVDVPLLRTEAIDREAPPIIHKPLELPKSKVRVKPLLTPDRKGKIFRDAVVDLIRSAKSELLFQNQYIKMTGAKTGFLKDLVDAIVDRAKKIDTVRIILRSGDLLDDVSALKRRGIDIEQSLKRLANTHTKGIVVDRKRVLIGSHNWSAAGVTLNRDASLIFDDARVAEYFGQAFDIDWARARPITFEPEDERVPELADPFSGPPPGFVRVPLTEYLEG